MADAGVVEEQTDFDGTCDFSDRFDLLRDGEVRDTHVDGDIAFISNRLSRGIEPSTSTSSGERPRRPRLSENARPIPFAAPLTRAIGRYFTSKSRDANPHS